MKSKHKKLKRKRAELAMLITRKAFRKYNTYVTASCVVNALHPMLINNRDKFIAAFTLRVAAPLHKLTDDADESKRHVISFVRRLAHYYGNFLASRRKSIVVNGKTISQYSYALVKVWSVHLRKNGKNYRVSHAGDSWEFTSTNCRQVADDFCPTRELTQTL